MTTWLDLVGNGRLVLEPFGADPVPSVEHVYLHDVRIDRDGPTLYLRFDLDAFPTAPPARWREQKCNTVQVLLGVALRSIELRGFATNNDVRLVIERIGPDFHVVVSGTTTVLADAEFVFLVKVSAYQNSLRPVP